MPTDKLRQLDAVSPPPASEKGAQIEPHCSPIKAADDDSGLWPDDDPGWSDDPGWERDNWHELEDRDMAHADEPTGLPPASLYPAVSGPWPAAPIDGMFRVRGRAIEVERLPDDPPLRAPGLWAALPAAHHPTGWAMKP